MRVLPRGQPAMRTWASTTWGRSVLVAAGVVASLVGGPRLSTAQTTTRIIGTVRDSAGHPVGRAEASVQGDSAISVANDSGQFTLATTRPRNVLLHVRRLGYEPLDKEVDLGDSGSVSVRIVMAAVSQSMATFRVVAKRTGVWGVVRTPWGAPIRDAQVEMLGGSVPVATTDSAGEFTLPTQRGGTFLVVARKRGFAYAQTGVTVRTDAGEEAEIV